MKRDDTRPSDSSDRQHGLNLIVYLRSSPLAKAIAEDGIEFEIERPADDFGRDIDFGDSYDEL